MQQLMKTMELASPSVRLSPLGVFRWLQSDSGRKWVMYGTVSGVAIVTSWLAFIVAHNGFGWSIVASQIFQTTISTIPAFLLSRYWVWAKDGKVSMRTEVLPFWVLSIAQFVISLGVIKATESWIESTFSDRSTRTVVVLIINLALYGVMWVGKFFFLNNLLFRSDQKSKAASVSTGR
jgi:putative flippase GtrA